MYKQNNAAKVSNLFAGTREKCIGCKKTVYPIEKVINNKLICFFFLLEKMINQGIR